MSARLFVLCLLAWAVTLGSVASAQTSSLGGRKRQADARRAPGAKPRVSAVVAGNPVVEKHSWIALKPAPPKTFKVNDLLTIIVREQRKFNAKAKLKTEKSYDITSDLKAFFKPTAGGLGSATFRRGVPNVEYEIEQEMEGKADAKRDDKFTTRLQATIIDVKPNGLLVIEANARMEHDEEISVITLTGTCRKQDVTLDNTILSTQIADKEIAVRNKGAVRDNTIRGWIPRIIDALRPF